MIGDGRPTSSLFDPLAWERAEQHPALSWWREHEPVSWHPHPGGQRGLWCVTAWSDVVAVSSDHETYSSRLGVVDLDDHDDTAYAQRRTFLEEDPPRHGAVRRLLASSFTPRAVRAFEGVTGELTSSVIDRLTTVESFDAVSELAERIPIRILALLLGVPEHRTDDLVRWGNQLLAGEGEPDPTLPFGSKIAGQVYELARAMAAERRGAPVGDVTSALLHGEVDGERLSEEEFLATWLMLVIAGNETTRHAISLSLLALTQAPHELDRWATDPTLTGSAVEELLRWTTPINWHRRTVSRPTTLGSVSLEAGDKVVIWFAAANRDPLVFTEPNRLDLGRSPNAHVTFGRGGPHFCLGAHLARLELRTVLGELIRRDARWAVVGEVQRVANAHLNGIATLPLRLHHPRH